MNEDDAFSIFMDDNRADLEQEYLEKLPPEDKPLDDDISDYLDDFNDDFTDFCRESFKEMNDVSETDSQYQRQYRGGLL